MIRNRVEAGSVAFLAVLALGTAACKEPQKYTGPLPVEDGGAMDGRPDGRGPGEIDTRGPAEIDAPPMVTCTATGSCDTNPGRTSCIAGAWACASPTAAPHCADSDAKRTSGDCHSGGTCNPAGMCVFGQGGTCSSPGQCSSGFCVAGRCCDSACVGECEECSSGICRNKPGICAPRGCAAGNATEGKCVDRACVKQMVEDCQGRGCGGTATGACNACAPGGKTCVGEQVLTCRPDGSGYGAPTDCPDNRRCVNGACSPTVCRTGFRDCGSTCVGQTACCPASTEACRSRQVSGKPGTCRVLQSRTVEGCPGLGCRYELCEWAVTEPECAGPGIWTPVADPNDPTVPCFVAKNPGVSGCNSQVTNFLGGTDCLP